MHRDFFPSNTLSLLQEKTRIFKLFQLLLHFFCPQFEINLSSSATVWMIWRRTIKTRRLFKSSSLLPQINFEIHLFHSASDERKKSSEFSNRTQLGRIGRGLSINKDFFILRSNDTKWRGRKSERCVYYTFFIGTKRGLASYR